LLCVVCRTSQFINYELYIINKRSRGEAILDAGKLG